MYYPYIPLITIFLKLLILLLYIFNFMQERISSCKEIKQQFNIYLKNDTLLFFNIKA